MLDDQPAQYRIGAISRLSGVPISTLRVWERRYGAFAPDKSAGRHRLYRGADIERAALLRTLTDLGYGIGTLVGQSTAALQALTQHDATRQGASGPAARSLMLVGSGLRSRLAAMRHRFGHVLEGVTVIKAQPRSDTAIDQIDAQSDACLIALPSLQGESLEMLRRLRERTGARRVGVLYAFAQDRVVTALKRDGFSVQREPLSIAGFADWLRELLQPQTPPAAPAASLPGAAVPARRYSDEMLHRFVAQVDTIRCECPRHLAELVMLLSNFEQYSQDCMNRDDRDAQLHTQLGRVAGSARAMLEDALTRVAEHEGVELDAADRTRPRAPNDQPREEDEGSQP